MQKLEDFGAKYQEYTKDVRAWLREVNPFAEWPGSIKPLLSTLTKQCGGEVFYSIHLITPGRARPQILFRDGGPPDLYSRRLKTDPADISEGCIGRTIADGDLVRYFPRVAEVDYYREANPSTKCELVVVVPGINTEYPLGAINLESDEEDAFDAADIAVFSLVGTLSCLLATLGDRETVIDALHRALAELTVDPETVPRKEKILEVALPALRTVLPFDAIAIVRTDLGDNRRLTFDFHDGYGNSPALDDFQNAQDSFTLHVLRGKVGEAVFENTDASGDFYRLRRYRDRTRYAIGAVLAGSSFGRTALILEFDQPRDHLQEQDTVALGQIMRLLLILWNQHDAARTAASYGRAANVIERLTVKPRMQDSSVETLLRNAAPNLLTSLHATLCGFYKVSDESAHDLALQEIALARPPLKMGTNVEWAKRVNAEWSKQIRALCERGIADYAYELTDPKEGEDRRFRLFAKTFRPFHEGPEVLFVSVKATPEESRWRNLRMDEASLKIIDVELALLEAVSERLEMSIKQASHQEALRQALRLWFAEPSAANDRNGYSDLETVLFRRAHQFLENWQIETPYSAVFVHKGSTLAIHRASMQHLETHSRDKTALEGGLIIPLPGRVSGEACGITATIFADGISRVSLRLKRDGSENCKMFWDKIVGVPSERRFFAGARIADQDTGVSYGVLTVNGAMWPPYSDFPIESEWRFLSVVETLARELGRYLSRISERTR